MDFAQLVVLSAFLFTNDGVMAVAEFGVVRTVAAMVGVPLVVSVGCRVPPGILLRAMAAVAALSAIAMAVLAGSDGPIAGILVSAAAGGVALGCFRPVVRALLPSITHSPDELLASNAATGFLDGVSALVGPALGSILAMVIGVPALLTATAAVMITAGLAAGRIPMTEPATRRHRTGEPADHRTRYSAGVIEVVHNAEVRLIGLLGMAQTGVRGATGVIAVVFAAEVLETGEAGVGPLYAAMGIGVLVVLPVMLKAVRHLGVHRCVTAGLALWGLPLAIAALFGHPGNAIGMFAIVGVGDALVDIGYYGVLQRSVASPRLTQVLGVIESMFQAGSAIGAVAGAVIVRHTGPQRSLVIVGLALPLLALVTAHRLHSFHHHLQRRDAAIVEMSSTNGAARSMAALDALAALTHVLTPEGPHTSSPPPPRSSARNASRSAVGLVGEGVATAC